MIAVWKFPLNLGANSVMMPADSEILSAAIQGERPGQLCCWARVVTTAPLQLRRVLVRGTGAELDSFAFSRFVATVQDGDYVWHVFEARS